MKRRKKTLYDPYAEMLGGFNRQGVQYVVVDMSGINYYATSAEDTFLTQDFDVFVKPTIVNIKKAIKITKDLGYNVSAGGKEVEDSQIKEIIRLKKTIIATEPQGITFEFILAVSGYVFSQMVCDATIFTVGNIPIKVGKLRKLLLSKKIAGRKKDMQFLKRYEILLREK